MLQYINFLLSKFLNIGYEHQKQNKEKFACKKCKNMQKYFFKRVRIDVFKKAKGNNFYFQKRKKSPVAYALCFLSH